MRASLAVGIPLVVLLVAGAASLLASAAVAPDTTPPSVEAVQPNDGTVFNDNYRVATGRANITVFASFTDGESGLSPDNATVSFSRPSGDAGPQPTEIRVTGDGSLALQIVATFELDDGAWRLEFRVTDGAGNTAVVERNITVDTTRPDVQVFAPAVVREPSVTVRIDVHEDGSGLELPLYLSYKSACGYSWLTKPFEVTLLPGRVVGEATFTVCISAHNQFAISVRDLAGNYGYSGANEVAYDLSAPTFSTFVPASFVSVDGPRVPLRVDIKDDATGVNLSRIEVQLSEDGGVTWGEWQAAEGSEDYYGTPVTRASATLNVTDGALAAVRWRATDLAGNGPNVSRIAYFYVNGPPFVVAYEPAEGSIIKEFSAVRFNATFADPDTDSVGTNFSSDLDGYIGPGNGERVKLSVGVHTITLRATDGHNHTVTYSYQIEVVPRTPPDPRPFFYTGILAGAMGLSAFAAWSRREDEELAETPPPKP